MRISLVRLCILLAVASPPAVRGQAALDGLTGMEALLQDHKQFEGSGPALTLEEAERIALADNPQIAVAVRRLSITQAHVPVAGALDDPMAMYRGWGIPWQQPWNYNQAQNMFSVTQNLPGRGKRALRTDVAESDVAQARAQLDQARLEVRVRVHKAFEDMLRAKEEIRFHEQHVGIARQAIEAARIKYAVGKVPQQDILKAQVALTRLAEHMIHFEQDADVARAQLNTLLGRDPAAPLRVTGELAADVALASADVSKEAALKNRPDLAAAREAAERSRKQQALANKAYTPDFSVSAGYMVMPPSVDMRNTYMIEGTMTLPWLNRHRHDAEISEAAAQTTEQDAEFAAMRNLALGEVQQAFIAASAAQRLARVYRENLRPQAEATLQASVIAYENDKTDFLDLLDSQMTVVDMDLAWVQAVGEFNARLADLELATGALAPATEVKP